jgi:NAD(P)-dependent dehydrogenase (short-subunit alcohol dehydrogenase family)
MPRQQIVLVTGGASGIGFAIVEALLAEGVRTVVADFDQANLDRCRDALGAAGGHVRLERLDVADEEAVVRSVAACEAEFGPLTGVVNAAGTGRDVPALETSADLFRKILDVNLIGSFVVSREAAKRMRARGAGSIVNIASVSGIAGNEGRVAYGASKAGVITMTKVMAVELAPLGIRVNAIAPGPIETPLVREIHTEDVRAAWSSAVPMRRYGSPAEIAGAALFLLDDGKSSYVTGQTICVDGGFTSAGIMTRTRATDASSSASASASSSSTASTSFPSASSSASVRRG